MDQPPLPLPPPPPFIDLDGDGIDDRVEAFLDTVERVKLQFIAALAKPPEIGEPQRRDTLPELLERVRRAPSVRGGVANPVISLPDGYQFRAVGIKTYAATLQVPEDIAAAGAVAASEALDPAKFPQYGWAIMEAFANAAKYARRSLVEQALSDRAHPAAHLHLGRQSGRWCSSFQLPTTRHLELARLALHPRSSPLIAGDARRWIDPLVQDRGKQAGKALRFNAVGIVRKWAAEGWEWIGPVNDLRGKALIDPYRLLLFRRNVTSTAVSVARASAAIVDGRRRWKVKPTIPDPALA
jgi:hypothetical protein